jgi:hypothetical protein
MSLECHFQVINYLMNWGSDYFRSVVLEGFKIKTSVVCYSEVLSPEFTFMTSIRQKDIGEFCSLQSSFFLSPYFNELASI